LLGTGEYHSKERVESRVNWLGRVRGHHTQKGVTRAFNAGAFKEERETGGKVQVRAEKIQQHRHKRGGMGKGKTINTPKARKKNNKKGYRSEGTPTS